MTHSLNRRRLLSATAVLGGAAAFATYAGRPALAEPAAGGLEALERANGTVIGVFGVNLETGRTVAHRAQDTFAMCSTFKAYLAAHVLQLVGRGERSLEQRLPVTAADIKPNSPRTEPRVGGDMTIAELCQAILQVSDNAAANILLGNIGGPPAVTAFARSIGDPRSRLDRFEIELNSAVPGDPRDTSTPEALAGGFRAFLAGDVLAPPQRQLLGDWMRANETSSMRAGLPVGWTTADKTGSGDYGTTNDVGIAYGPKGQRVLLAVMTRSAADDPDAENNRPLVGEVTATVFPELLRA
ncbi:class A beta-lactamase [Mycolicibacterium litorale]|uniref:Beta-lactamase n=1 Tax=Mycolicibacterium litorale TaxID=758802 RepID=A0AAD1IRT7_9MYCO|nr:class A beta-lactamase [Mycolicibacterium litorale]MCV7415368.1 class A beta-lactamase [Mycolicibacterium litorale]TDY08622.1 beta-lactamase class A [Mycolicibacterium litorale]BBY16548.1 beta-lactamase [Mycolicibacterium litorale]